MRHTVLIDAALMEKIIYFATPPFDGHLPIRRDIDAIMGALWARLSRPNLPPHPNTIYNGVWNADTVEIVQLST